MFLFLVGLVDCSDSTKDVFNKDSTTCEESVKSLKLSSEFYLLEKGFLRRNVNITFD